MAKKSKKHKADDEGDAASDRLKLARKEFEQELYELQVELTRLQAWAVAEGARSSSCSRAAIRPARAA